MIHARSDLRGLKIDDHLFRIGGHGRYLPEIDMERSLSIIWLSGCFAIFSGVVVCANAFPSFRLLEIAAMFLSVALIPMAIYAIVFTNIRTALIGITAVAIGLSVWTTNWPAKARFTSAQAKFEVLLAEIENGKTISAPRWVGSYRVQQIDIKKTGAICGQSIVPEQSPSVECHQCFQSMRKCNFHQHQFLDLSESIFLYSV